MTACDEPSALLARLASRTGQPLTFMEVCGTHTMAAARSGLRDLLPPGVRLISGPGCPVCVTPVGYVDHALALATQAGVTLATFGDLVRVPGTAREDGGPTTLEQARAAGADVRVVYSPREALELARGDADRAVVFLGVGFETTAPILAATVKRAAVDGVESFSLLSAAKTIPRALDTLASNAELALDGFLCPGHVSVILGPEAYAPLAAEHHLPCVIAGFEPVEILRGLCALVAQVAAGRAAVENQYPGAVRPGGNARARALLDEVFAPADSTWRGLGTIAGSGLELRAAFAAHDAARRFAVEVPPPREPAGCRCGDVLRGVLAPTECGLFGRTCTPDHPVGACMVSSEGSCAAAFRFPARGAQEVEP